MSHDQPCYVCLVGTLLVRVGILELVGWGMRLALVLAGELPTESLLEVGTAPEEEEEEVVVCRDEEPCMGETALLVVR